MRFLFGSVVSLAVLVALGAQLYASWGSVKELEDEYRVLEERLKVAEEDRGRLQAELDYLRRPENLEKELKARFNYKRPGEKLIIVVPPQATSTRE